MTCFSSKFCYIFLISYHILSFKYCSFVRRSSLPQSYLRSTIGRTDITPASKECKVAIVGGGISGLSCADEIVKCCTDFVVIDSSDKVGGRIQTDYLDGYLLDRGFQVFIEQYPEANELFDYNKLNLNQFLPGAIVRFNKKFHLVSDPFRRPEDLFPSLLTPIGTFFDKAKVGLYSVLLRYTPLSTINNGDEMTTEEYLMKNWDLSPSIINRFFKPFYQGIFLSPLKFQSSRMFEFVFKMFAEGAASLPSGGMGAITQQVADRLPARSLHLGYKVVDIKMNEDGSGKIISCQSKDGKIMTFRADNIVLATEAPSSKELLDKALIQTNTLFELAPLPETRSSICVYYGFEGLPPVVDPILVLNGENDLDGGYSPTINNVCFPSQVSSSYAPDGSSLASITIVGAKNLLEMSDEELDRSTRTQLSEWWGEERIKAWKLLKIYKIPFAQPAQIPPYVTDVMTSSHRYNQHHKGEQLGIYVCGDHIGTATLNGAIESGKRVGKLIAQKLGKK